MPIRTHAIPDLSTLTPDRTTPRWAARGGPREVQRSRRTLRGLAFGLLFSAPCWLAIAAWCGLI